MPYGLESATIAKIRKIFADHPEIKQAILYGSRALGTYRKGSDIDLTLTGADLYQHILNQIENQLDDLFLPYTFDLSIYREIENDSLRNHVERVGIVFYSSSKNRITKISGNSGDGIMGGWRHITLGDLCEFRRGLTYKKSDEVPVSKNAVLRANNITVETGKINLDEIRFIREDIDIPDKKMLQAGGLLVCTASGSKKHLGKIGIVEDDTNYAFGGFMGLLLPSAQSLPKYLFWFTRSNFYREFIADLSDGVNINNLKWTQLSKLQVPLPPLPEQKRIVAILDKAFAAIATATANTEKNLASARELFESELTRVFHPSHPARGGVLDEWRSHALDELATISAGNSAPQDKALFQGGTYPFVRTADVGRIRFGQIKSTTDYLNDAGIKKLRWFPQGTILFPKSGASTFLNHRVIMEIDGYVASHLATIQVDRKKIHPWFLLYFLHTVKAQDLVQDHSYPSLNLPLIKSISIPVPPLSQQKRIVSFLDKLSTAQQSLISIYETKSNALSELKQSLLHMAFTGELTADSQAENLRLSEVGI